ncbi:methyltransferase domain-containing protein [Polynucleobacter sp. MWH-UH23A]|uniref:class I SAM-dependent methyltransferase n=1 Tax=Polynucleobacter sp. MWH-UH23A TaxID=1855613 RepID=UPI003364D2CF
MQYRAHFHKLLKIILRPKGKYAFILYAKKLQKLSILDVGCGNNSWKDFFLLYPTCQYSGLDIQSYGTINNTFGTNIVVDREDFNLHLKKFANSFDVVFSSHNIEHCDDYKLTFNLLKKATKIDGIIYISFPTEKSTKFPKRSGALNYYSDATHKDPPPDFNYLKRSLCSDGFEILYSSRRYRPAILFFLGLIQEPLSYLLNKNLRFTWGFYGFESVIWAKRIY